MSASKKTITVLGRIASLSDGRLVFLGSSVNQPNVVFIAFRNESGEEMKLKLSDEAFAALIDLHNNPMHGMPLRDFPHKQVWQQVTYDEKERP